ncbi:MAG: glycosyltransferase [Ktedonobacterales bacterium]
MVKDEETVIARCLVSLASFCDRIVLLDTGSTDETLSIASTVLNELGVPFRILHRPFDGFAASRTFLVKHSREDSDWVLMVDADMTLSGVRPELPDDSEIGLVEFIYDGLVHTRAAYLSSPVEWRYEGELHEYVTADVPYGAARIAGVTLTHHGHAGDQRSAEEDLEILERNAKLQPNEPRWKFYMAQTFKVMHRNEEAIAMYREAAILGEDGSEWVWYCMFQSALIARDTVALLRACVLRPWRAEGWYALACLLSDEQMYDSALPYAEKASQLQEPDDFLFINRAVYQWGARYEWTICLAATGHLREAINNGATMLRHRYKMPPSVVIELERNMEAWEALGVRK